MVMKDNAMELFDSKKTLILKAPVSKNRTFQINIEAAEVHYLKTTKLSEECWL